MSDTQGNFVWYELMTSDVNGAIKFYKDVIGWGTQAFEGGEMPYTMWTVGETPLGGVMTLPDEAKKMGKSRVRIVQSSETRLWWILPPFSLILTPAWTNVAGDAVP